MKLSGLNKAEFKSLLELATKESLFLFNNEYYSQIDGVAMGSPLGPTLANIFLVFHEEKWLESCPTQFKPIYYKRYVDDIFCLFNSENQVNKFHKYLCSRHKNMNFSKEIESECTLSFLDISITRNDECFITSLYKKPTFSGLYLNFKSYMPLSYKKGLVLCLLFRIYSICSNWNLIHEEIKQLKCLLIRNKYPLHFMNQCIYLFLNAIFIKKVKPLTAPKNEFIICLPFLGNETTYVKKKLNKLFSSVFPAYKLKIVLNSVTTLSSFLNFKDKLNSNIRSLVLYKYTCGNCNITYIGKTKRHFKVRMCEHLGLSYITGKPRKYNAQTTTAVREHLRTSQHIADFDNFKILGNAKNDFRLQIKESLLIGKDQPLLNKQVKRFKLSLF